MRVRGGGGAIGAGRELARLLERQLARLALVFGRFGFVRRGACFAGWGLGFSGLADAFGVGFCLTLGPFQVVAVVAFVKADFAVALESEDAGGDVIEKPAIVRNDKRAAGEFRQRFFEHAECQQVEIVGRFVEDEQVAATTQQLGKLDAVAFTTRQRRDFGVGETIIKQQHAQKRPDVNRPVFQKNAVAVTGHFFKHASAVVELGAALVQKRNPGVDPADHFTSVGQKLGLVPGDRFTEAYAGYRYLTGRGVPGDDLLVVTDGSSTWDSLRAAERVLRREGLDRVTLVSDSYHSSRLLGVADEVGLDAGVSPSGAAPTVPELLRETGLVALGQVIGYGRMLRLSG